LLRAYSQIYCSTYAIRPAKLFDGVDQRLCILLGKSVRDAAQRGLWTTRYHHWHSVERTFLFGNIRYSKTSVHPRLERIPQIGDDIAKGILKRLEQKSNAIVSSYYARPGHGFLMHYHRSPRYWIRAMDFEQYFRSQTRSRSVHHFRDLYFRDAREAKFIGSILNSSLFFLWFSTMGNGRNITGADVEQFPIGVARSLAPGKSSRAFDVLMMDYKKHSFIRVRNDCEFQEFRPSLSKSLIDVIDSLLAKHYSFSDEELDFIINYEIKYRMGREELEDDA
jgi:hypothetical protein